MDSLRAVARKWSSSWRSRLARSVTRSAETPAGSFKPSISKPDAAGSHLNTEGFHVCPMKPPSWPGQVMFGLLWITSGSTTEEKGERSVGFSAPMTAARLGQSLVLGGKLSAWDSCRAPVSIQ